MRPVVLIVLDGWGVAPSTPGNAISLSKLPFYNHLLKTYPNGLLEASGESVGLPNGEDGNTETGHINIGAGYVVYQDLPRINLSVADGSFFSNHAFLGAIDHARKYQSNIHFLGLIGSGGVHSNIEHLLALLQLMKEQGFYRVYLHLITDGRDSPPKSSIQYIERINAYLENIGFGQISTIMGRYYAMDRDHRWERTELAYKTMTLGSKIQYKNPIQAVKLSYSQGITDEFIKPATLIKQGKPVGLVRANDSVIFFNYRIDRPRQLTKAFVLDNYAKEANIIDFDPYAVKYFKKHNVELSHMGKPFKRDKKIDHLYFVTMTEYSRYFHVSSVAFPPHIVAHPLGEAISNEGLWQLRMSESEKERFVTYYFNGQREKPFENEDRIIIPSPKVATYDLQPEMSADDLTSVLIKQIKKKKYDFILVNYANPDMVAHTGMIKPTIKACETIDLCLSKLIPEVLTKNGTVFITGDHGNAEELINPQTGTVDTEHSTYPVPFIAINKKWMNKNIRLSKGILSDIAPSILDYLHIKRPDSMTGRNLLKNVID